MERLVRRRDRRVVDEDVLLGVAQPCGDGGNHCRPVVGHQLWRRYLGLALQIVGPPVDEAACHQVADLLDRAAVDRAELPVDGHHRVRDLAGGVPIEADDNVTTRRPLELKYHGHEFLVRHPARSVLDRDEPQLADADLGLDPGHRGNLIRGLPGAVFGHAVEHRQPLQWDRRGGRRPPLVDEPLEGVPLWEQVHVEVDHLADGPQLTGDREHGPVLAPRPRVRRQQVATTALDECRRREVCGLAAAVGPAVDEPAQQDVTDLPFRPLRASPSALYPAGITWSVIRFAFSRPNTSTELPSMPPS